MFFSVRVKLWPEPLATNKTAFSTVLHPRYHFEMIVITVSIPDCPEKLQKHEKIPMMIASL